MIDAPGSWHIAEGTGFEITPFFLAMMLGLTLFTASTVAEIVRGSIQALPRGQVEAAISLSLNPFQRLRLVILPQALRRFLDEMPLVKEDATVCDLLREAHFMGHDNHRNVSHP